MGKDLFQMGFMFNDGYWWDSWDLIWIHMDFISKGYFHDTLYGSIAWIYGYSHYTQGLIYGINGCFEWTCLMNNTKKIQ